VLAHELDDAGQWVKGASVHVPCLGTHDGRSVLGGTKRVAHVVGHHPSFAVASDSDRRSIAEAEQPKRAVHGHVRLVAKDNGDGGRADKPVRRHVPAGTGED
jgi:hypothetical protein